ncbi:MAG: crossover junction endodeoxyribonuclease RuvC [Bacillota bacterium]|nr:crossover junction endodeoxyribonuclease RuvC [Bacillota bacterium]
MRILGVDPGYAISGYAIVDYEGNKFKVVKYGVVRTPSKMQMQKRLNKLFDKYSEIIQTYKPDHMAIEELFFNKNVKTAIAVGQARGVHIVAASQNNVPVYEYTPLQVKQGVVGYGRAEKAQVQEMVKLLLNLKTIPQPDDAADALAISICHAHTNRFSDEYKL